MTFKNLIYFTLFLPRVDANFSLQPEIRIIISDSQLVYISWIRTPPTILFSTWKLFFFHLWCINNVFYVVWTPLNHWSIVSKILVFEIMPHCVPGMNIEQYMDLCWGI